MERLIVLAVRLTDLGERSGHVKAGKDADGVLQTVVLVGGDYRDVIEALDSGDLDALE